MRISPAGDGLYIVRLTACCSTRFSPRPSRTDRLRLYTRTSSGRSWRSRARSTRWYVPLSLPTGTVREFTQDGNPDACVAGQVRAVERGRHPALEHQGEPLELECRVSILNLFCKASCEACVCMRPMINKHNYVRMISLHWVDREDRGVRAELESQSSP